MISFIKVVFNCYDFEVFVGGYVDIGICVDIEYYLVYLEVFYSVVRDGMLVGKMLVEL